MIELPSDIDAEASVLGGVLLSDSVLDPLRIDVALQPDDFHLARHQLVFGAMVRLRDAGEPVDALTVVANLDEAGTLDTAGGGDYIHSLVGHVPSLANVRQYGRIVKEKSLLRQMLLATDRIQHQIAGGGDPQQLIADAHRCVLEVNFETEANRELTIERAVLEELEALEELAGSGRTLTGVPSGFSELDELTGGFQPGTLTILAARPSMGKSVLAAQFAESAAKADKPAAIYSVEMSKSELVQRMLAGQTSIESSRLRKGGVVKHEWATVQEAGAELAKLPLLLDDSSDLSINTLRSKVRRTHARLLAKGEKGLSLVVVDYLQLLSTEDRSGRNRVEQIGEITRGLKLLARELDMAVVAVSQLSRQVEHRNPPRPILSDLRDSGAIEQDADLVLLLYREDYYDRESTRIGEADLIVAKHRGGAVGELTFTFQAWVPRFSQHNPQARQSPPAVGERALPDEDEHTF